ncbi:MAG: oxidative damage protection protein [Candidatus Neomarinimicrobiota bacterium]|jgi:Fe-S cluster biosynthesis and repair protein YggX|nr:oxidative damage protection protein [Candidatus Neomarinimicrobiota bacterium]HJP42621.1 oxidative damage protection protein [Gammaproteobacteria bacterium]|tara:strand:- start:96 stop:371 length:276 start_codon:yes stop_codon:yes gene_type:complete
MSRQVFCEHFQKELEGLDRPPYPGELGEKIYQSVSKQAWNTWIEHQTMLINENQLSMLDSKARKYLQEEMTKFLFGKGSEKPREYVPPDIK